MTEELERTEDGWAKCHSRHIGPSHAVSQKVVDEIDDLMDLVVASKAATQAGDMLSRFTSRHPDKKLARIALEESKRKFNEQVDKKIVELEDAE